MGYSALRKPVCAGLGYAGGFPALRLAGRYLALTTFSLAVAGPQFRELMAFQAARARTYLAEGLRLLDSLDRRSALCVGTFAGLYRETLDRIEAGGFDVFGEKTRLSTPRKLSVVARGLLR